MDRNEETVPMLELIFGCVLPYVKGYFCVGYHRQILSISANV